MSAATGEDSVRGPSIGSSNSISREAVALNGRRRTEGRHSRHSVFYRFLLTYLVVLFVPIILLTIFQYTYYFDVLRSQILTEKQRGLERSADLIAQQFAQLGRIVVRMGLSADFRPFNFQDVPYDGYALIRAINSYVYDNSFSERIFVHFSDDGNVYTTYNAQRVDEFIESSIGSRRVFNAIVGSDSYRTFHAVGSRLVLAHNLPPGRIDGSYGTIMFFVDQSLVSGFFTDADTAYEIRDLEGRPFFNSREDWTAEPDDVVLTYRSSDGLVFENRIRAEDLSGDLVRYRNMYLVVLVLILAVSFPLVYIVAVSQYNPIDRLAKFVRQVTGGENEPEAAQQPNELRRIQDEIREYVHKVNPAVKTQLVYDLLNGKIETTAQISDRSREMELRWGATRHTVMILRSRDGTILAPGWFDDVEARCRRDSVGPVVEILVHQSPQNDQIVLIVGFNGRIDRADIRALIGDRTRWQCGCGSAKQSPEMLNTAYAEAQRALEYCILGGNNEIVLYDEIGAVPATNPRSVLDTLNAALERRDLDGVEEAFAGLQRVVQDAAFSLFDIKMVYYELLNMAVRINEKWQYPDIFQIENMDSIEEVLGLIREIVSNALREQQGVHPIPEFVERLQQYIDENFTDRMLSLKLLEDEFGYSVAYISRSFKKHIGVNISTYISTLRMNRAKELLRNSDLPVGSIIMSVGYNDSSAFGRTFRTHEGTTPGAYRARYK